MCKIGHCWASFPGRQIPTVSVCTQPGENILLRNAFKWPHVVVWLYRCSQQIQKVLRQLVGKKTKQWNNKLNDWWTDIWRNKKAADSSCHYPFYIFSLIGCELAARWPVCIWSWLTVSGSGSVALRYRLLIVLFWAAVRHFCLSPDRRHLAKWQRDD